MDDVENAGEHEEEEVFDVEVVEGDDPPAKADSAGALAALAGGGPETSADALGAMASGQNAAPVDAIAAAEARQEAHAGEALASLASGESAAAADDGDDDSDDVVRVDDGEDGAEFGFAEGESIHVGPERIKAAREQRRRMVDKADSLSFKKTMIPLLLAVGVLLLGISGLTAVMTSDSDATAGQGDPSMMDEYGGLLIWAALPLGVVLIGGAIMFHAEVRRVEESRRADE